jgi:hypothetical protein
VSAAGADSGGAAVAERHAAPRVHTRQCGQCLDLTVMVPGWDIDEPERLPAAPAGQVSAGVRGGYASRSGMTEQSGSEREAYAIDARAPQQRSEALAALLERTHGPRLSYKPAERVYPWVDLHPDGRLRSIYSGRPSTPSRSSAPIAKSPANAAPAGRRPSAADRRSGHASSRRRSTRSSESCRSTANSSCRDHGLRSVSRCAATCTTCSRASSAATRSAATRRSARHLRRFATLSLITSTGSRLSRRDRTLRPSLQGPALGSLTHRWRRPPRGAVTCWSALGVLAVTKP